MTDFARTRSLFHLPEGVVYLDGNSLGPLPKAAVEVVMRTMREEWGEDLIRAWNTRGWIGKPRGLGDRIGRLIGAPKGTVVVGDTLSIKVFQALAAALALRPERRVILSDDGNFPTDLYMAQGLARFLKNGTSLRTPAPEDVEAAMFAVCRSYGLDRCEPTVTFTLLSISYQPSLVDDPVTASRTVRRRGTDYTRLAAVFRLVDDLSDPETHISLEEAYRRLAEIRRNRHPYTKGALTVASGLLAGAASLLVGGGWLVFLLAALGAMLGDRLAWFFAGRGLPEFYQFLVAAMPPATLGVLLTLLHADLRPSAVITGGLFALIPGRALVSAVR